MNQNEASHGGRPRPRPHCVRWGPSGPPRKGHSTLTFRLMSIVAKWLDGLGCHGMEVGLGPCHIVLDRDPVRPPTKKGAKPPSLGPCLLWPNGWMDQDVTWCGGRPRPRPQCVRCARAKCPKSGGAAVPLSVGAAAWVPSNTTSPGQRPTSVPSGIQIHPAVWLQ